MSDNDEFDLGKLETVAARVRAEDAQLAITAATTRAADLSRQPKLKFKSFDVSSFAAAVSPDSSYRLLSQTIGAAKKEILLYIYNAGADYLLGLLKDAKARGVNVRVMVDLNDPNDGKSEEWETLKRLKVDLKEAPSKGARRVFTHCHQKFLVVDGKTLLVESANWSESAIPIAKKGEYKPGNREWFLRVDDAELARWFAGLFDKDWAIPALAAGMALPDPLVFGEEVTAALFVRPKKLFDIDTFTSAATMTPVISPVNYLEEVGKLLKAAKRSIDIEQQYIKAGDGVNELLQIVHSKKKTCEIRIITSPKFAAWDHTKDTLRAAGLFQKLRALNLQHFIHCHNKGVIVDGRYSVVSSTNWSENSIHRAREAGLIVDSKDLAAYFTEVFDQDWKTADSAAKASAAMVTLSAADLV
jgi:phosphatidylserine/phosphatidylglycerophosphate/cardiolipin synthase-like enzyme